MDGITSIIIPDSIISIGDYAFESCGNLSSIKIPCNVGEIGVFIFEDCSNLSNIEVAAGNSVYHASENCLIETQSKTLIAGCKNSTIPADGSVTSIGHGAFSGCSNLTDIVIPVNVTNIQDYAFYNCGLKSIAIPAGVEKIGKYTFYSCKDLTSIVVSENIISIENHALGYCLSLNNITYNGTKVQWEAISKGTDWDVSAGTYTIHCTDGDITK